MHIPPTIYPSPAQEFVHVIVTGCTKSSCGFSARHLSPNGMAILVLYHSRIEERGISERGESRGRIQVSSSYVDPTLVHLVLLLVS